MPAPRPMNLDTAICGDIRARSHMRERSWTGLALTVAKRPAPPRPQALRRIRALTPVVLTGEII